MRRWAWARRHNTPSAACGGLGPQAARARCNSCWPEAATRKRSAGCPRRSIDRSSLLLGPPEGARVWVSATPFVPPRYLKRRGTNALFGQINAELAGRGLPPADQLEELPGSVQTLSLRRYTRRRQPGGAQPPIDAGFAIRLRFSRPVRGPLTLGYASHFGLGLFYAGKDEG